MDPTATTCARHPGTETRLACSQCDTPICPRCAVQTPVGQKCPACARQPKTARRQGKPQQYGKATAFGVLAAGVAVLVLPFVFGLPFLSWIATGFVGFGIGHAVLTGAEGNRADPFRNLAVGLAVAAVLGTFLIRYGVIVPGGLGFVLYLAAAYGAWARFNR